MFNFLIIFYFFGCFLFFLFFFFFFFNDTATTEIYTLSLHDALPTSWPSCSTWTQPNQAGSIGAARSEEHTSELQSLTNLVCRLLLEKKKTQQKHASDGKQNTKKKHNPTNNHTQ